MACIDSRWMNMWHRGYSSVMSSIAPVVAPVLGIEGIELTILSFGVQIIRGRLYEMVTGLYCLPLAAPPELVLPPTSSHFSRISLTLFAALPLSETSGL